MKKQSVKPVASQVPSSGQRGKIKSDFPKHTLEEALRVPTALAEKHSSQPLPPTETAIAVGVSPGSSEFRTLLSSSIKYGLTTGSYNQERVALTDLGRRIVEPTSEEDRRQALNEAALSPVTFQNIFQYLRGKKLPDDVFFQNTVVREFEVPREHAAVCVRVFITNIKFTGMVKEAATGLWLSTEMPQVAVPATDKPDQHNGEDEPPLTITGDVRSECLPDTRPQPKPSNGIFIGHGANKQPLEQLKNLLGQYKIPFRVAVEEANEFRPISEKVADVMKDCGAAILIFTADTEFKDANGSSVWKPSENVVYELGAASVLYGNRIIIFKEKLVSFPTNFRDIGHIAFDKDQLEAKVNELFKELISFGLIKISIGG